MAQPYLSVIIPAYNESKRIPLTLIDMDKRLSREAYSYEILVVNDGSKDNTAEVVRGMEKMIKNLKLVDNVENKGKGGVVRQGMLTAKGQYRLFTDADNATSIDHFNAMIPHFKAGYDVVVGSRAMKGSKMDPGQPLYRQIPGKLSNLLIQLVVLPGLWDTQCGFKCFSAKAVENIFPKAKIKGFAFDPEILILSKRIGYKIKEVPIYWKNDPDSKVSPANIIKMAADLMKIRRYLISGNYGI